MDNFHCISYNHALLVVMLTAEPAGIQVYRPIYDTLSNFK